MKGGDTMHSDIYDDDIEIDELFSGLDALRPDYRDEESELLQF